MAKQEKATKDAQVMTRMTEDTYKAMQRIGLELDRSVSWLLNDLAVKFIAQHDQKKAK